MSDTTLPNDIPPFELRGHRFKPLTWATMTEAQKTMTRQVLGGQRGSMQGPYNVLLYSPEVGHLAQQFGAHTRFHSSLPLALNELAILLVARDWTAQFVWWIHRRIAQEAGLPMALIDAVALHQTPKVALARDVQAVYDFGRELLAHRRVTDATHAAMVASFGDRGVVDLMAIMSYYTLVSMALNVDGYPLPEGATPELLPLP